MANFEDTFPPSSQERMPLTVPLAVCEAASKCTHCKEETPYF